MVRIGIVGIGFMGRIHFLAARGLSDARVVAVCSREAKKLVGDWSTTRGNFGPPPGRVDLAGVTPYSDFATMLANPDIGLVDLCTPTDQHPAQAMAALAAGKHVLVEKAIALTIAEADAMLAAAAKAGRQLMVAHVLPFFPEFAFAADAVRSGRFGKLLGAHFKRVIARPDWSADIGDAAKTGGPAIDLHIHDTHFIGLLAGLPQGVFSTGRTEGDAVQYLTTQHLYGTGGPSVTASCGAIAMAGRPFVHGFEIYLEQATLAYDSGGVPLTVITPEGATQPSLDGGGDPLAAFALELQAAVDGVRGNCAPPLLSAKLARDALALCHAECESVRTGRVVCL